MSRIGVFVCWCGTNISATVDCPRVAEEAYNHPRVVFSTHYQYMCSDPGRDLIVNAIREHRLDRIVVASCSPRMHERTFRSFAEAGGLNPYLCEMANIRDQCSWCHPDKEMGTKKAVDLVMMAIAKVNKNKALSKIKVPVTKRALVIGGGISGIQASIDLADAGFETILVERTPSIGGKMAMLDKTFPTLDCSACILTPKMVEVSQKGNVTLYTFAEVEEVSGYIGNFKVKIRKKARGVDESKCTGCGVCEEKCPTKVPSEFNMGLSDRKAIYIPFPQAVPKIPVIDRAHCRQFTKGKCGVCQKVCPREAITYTQEDRVIEEEVGAIIVATGFEQFDHTTYDEYGNGKFKDVITGLHFERIVNAAGPTGGHIVRPSDHREPESVVFIQCVGSRDETKGKPYCSRVCCMYTAKQALLLKEHSPKSQAFIFYMDIRAPGKNYEEFIKRVQEEFGVNYIRGRVSRIYEKNGKLIVKGADTLAGVQVEIEADLVVLATGLIPQPDAVKLAQLLGIPYDEHFFYTELHPKLGPVETVTGGVFVAGACQFPKDIPDCVSTASGAASKAMSLLSREELEIEPTVAYVDRELCSGCFACKDVCAYSAIEPEEIRDRKTGELIKVVAKVNSALCHGCGACAATCRGGAINVEGFTNEQLFDEIAVL